jgi:hypothetical protein
VAQGERRTAQGKSLFSIGSITNFRKPNWK